METQLMVEADDRDGTQGRWTMDREIVSIIRKNSKRYKQFYDIYRFQMIYWMTDHAVNRVNAQLWDKPNQKISG